VLSIGCDWHRHSLSSRARDHELLYVQLFNLYLCLHLEIDTTSDFSTLPAAENDTAAVQNWKMPGPSPATFTNTATPTTVQYAASNGSAYFTYQGNWASHGTGTNHFSGDANSCSNDPVRAPLPLVAQTDRFLQAASFAFAFTGTSFSYFTSTGSDRGPFKVFLDGQEYSGTALASSAETPCASKGRLLAATLTRSIDSSVYSASNIVLGVHWVRCALDL
jgi:hypothetical protein